MDEYKGIIFDVDGVLLDSNTLKENNIREAARPFASSERLNEFVSYFTGLNGVPREGKIAFYFGEGTDETKAILSHYNQLNAESLSDVEVINGALETLRYFHGQFPIRAVSGGAQEEVRNTLKNKGLSSYFDQILGGPESKLKNVQRFASTRGHLFFGDSRHDHEVALEMGFDFVFLYQHTQFGKWKNYFSEYPEVEIRVNLADWLHHNIHNNLNKC